jgi:hypothetical protein
MQSFASTQTPRLCKSLKESNLFFRLSSSAQVALREQSRCAVSGYFDMTRAIELSGMRREDEIPPGPRCRMQVAHIIPFLNDFDELVCCNLLSASAASESRTGRGNPPLGYARILDNSQPQTISRRIHRDTKELYIHGW